MGYGKSMTNATGSVVYPLAGPHNVPINGNVKDIKALAVGIITYTDNNGESSTVPVLQGEYLNMRGNITVTTSTVDYLVYT